ncbi:signal peptide containing protein [Theileria equi strain WA]|uniref:Signal peptide containing protein n=1 Tax=Theileria equi strain WA TaxID=1537102 RepID=L1LE63_THEEQ|nr:signal peptide containing protein [Theileria equi strain WA]EKX73540.1 signal peptide containing protein [Theileria equi strain WA]|eukprot:XP_004832992.1 signal peptide containing protein [Theileria equi strain WA]
MKILAVLWTVCLVGLCHGGGDDGKGLKGAVAQQDPVKPVQPNTQGPPGQTQANPSTPTQQGQAAKPVTASSGKADVLDLASPDESKVDIVKASRNEVEKKEYYPKDTSKITSVMDGGVSMWTATGNEKCCFARSYTKGDSSFLYITIMGGNDLTAKFCEKAGGAWNEVDEEPFNDGVTTMIGGAVKYTSQFGSKVDPTLFNALDSFEDNVKVLKLTPKKGAKATKLTFDSKVVWEDKKPCSSVLFYMDCGTPLLAVIKTKSAGGESRVYVYRDGDQWKDDKEGDHKNKLTALKERCKPGETLDISKREDTDLGIYHCTPYGSGDIDHSFNLRNVAVTKVVDGEYTVWRAGKNEKTCTWAQNIVGNKETLRLEIQTAKKEDILFRKEGGKWKRVQVTQPKASQGSPNPASPSKTTPRPNKSQ